MRPDPETGKLVPAVSGEELVEMLAWPEAPPLELDDFGSVPSFDVHGELALSLARRVIEHAGPPRSRRRGRHARDRHDGGERVPGSTGCSARICPWC